MRSRFSRSMRIDSPSESGVSPRQASATGRPTRITETFSAAACTEIFSPNCRNDPGPLTAVARATSAAIVPRKPSAKRRSRAGRPRCRSVFHTALAARPQAMKNGKMRTPAAYAKAAPLSAGRCRRSRQTATPAAATQSYRNSAPPIGGQRVE